MLATCQFLRARYIFISYRNRICDFLELFSLLIRSKPAARKCVKRQNTRSNVARTMPYLVIFETPPKYRILKIVIGMMNDEARQ